MIFLNCMIKPKRKQTNPQQAHEKGKKALWSQLLKITLKLQITEVIVSYLILVLAHGVTDCFETLSVQGQKRVLMSFTPLFLREQDNSQLSAQYYNQTPSLGLEQESARYGNLKKGLMQFSVKYQWHFSEFETMKYRFIIMYQSMYWLTIDRLL